MRREKTAWPAQAAIPLLSESRCSGSAPRSHTSRERHARVSQESRRGDQRYHPQQTRRQRMTTLTSSIAGASNTNDCNRSSVHAHSTGLLPERSSCPTGMLARMLGGPGTEQRRPAVWQVNRGARAAQKGRQTELTGRDDRVRSPISGWLLRLGRFCCLEAVEWA